MSNAIPPILVQIAADVSQLKAGLAQAESSIKGMNSTVATANTGMQNMIGTAKRMAGAMGVAFAATQIVQFGKDVVMSASSMNESISKVNVVFGQSADAVFKFGDSAAKNMGMSNQAAIEAAGTYGNLFQAFGIGQTKAGEMSTTLVQLAADLGSFNNTSTEEAINALRSGLAGETEPLKRFGVALNEVTLKNKAFEMGFGTIKGAMDPAIKAQVTYALVMEQTKLAQGDYERTSKGTANTMKTLAAQFADAKVAIGDLLLPAFNALLAVGKVIIPIIKGLAKYFKDNADAIKIFVGILATATAAFYAYKAAMIATKTIMIVYTAVTKSMAAGHTLGAIAALNFRGAMMMLNMAIRANPVGAIVTALTLVAVGFAYAWKHSEKFRAIVIKGIQIVLNAVGYLVGGIGTLIGMFAKIPGMGWAKGIAKGADDAANSIRKTSDKLAELNKQAAYNPLSGIATGGGGDSGGGTGKGKGGLLDAAAAKKKADSIKKTMADVAKIYKDMNEVIADSQDKVAAATKNRDEDTAAAHKTYNEAIEKADKTLLEATSAAYKRNKEQIDSINKDYAKRTADIEEKLQDKIADLRQKAADKQQSIIQQSMDRLRNAFASKTGFNLVDAFTGGKSTEELLADLKTKLSAAKDLAQNAGLLQAKGFSQTFIEQVVSAGPEVGNSLAKSILDSSPESIKELQKTFDEMEKVSGHGVDAIAQTMNSGGKLATEELMKAYGQVSIDLAASLADANAEYSKAMADANATRDEALAAASKDLTEALAEADKNYKEAVAEVAKTLTENLAAIQKTYNEALDQIAKDTQKKIDSLKEKLIELANTLSQLGAKQAAIGALSGAPGYPPATTPYNPLSGNAFVDTSKTPYNPLSSFNLTQNNYMQNTNPAAILAPTLTAIKFGTSITVPASFGGAF